MSRAFAVGAGMPVAIHLAESEAEIAFLRDGEGPFADGLRARGFQSSVGRTHRCILLVELGVVLGRPLLIHCVRVDETDIAFIAEYGCPVAHCPTSNAMLGHGVAPLRELLDAGAIVGLGSDSRRATTASTCSRRHKSRCSCSARAADGPMPRLGRSGDARDARRCPRAGTRRAGRLVRTGQGG